MARYRRINIDGVHQSETKLGAVALLPGTVVELNADQKFAVVTANSDKQSYVVEAGYHQGLTVDQEIPLGDSVQAEYASPNRELVLRMAAGEYKKDSMIKVANGKGAISGDEDAVFAYSQEAATLKENELLRVRIK